MTQRTAADRRSIVLIVDDEEANRIVLDRILQGIGYATKQAESAEAALASLASGLPDLILLDLQMPGMDGFQLVRILKTDGRTRPIPTIIVTGNADRDSRLAALRGGAEDFITKPVDEAELAARVRNHLRLKEYGDFLREYNATLQSQVDERTRQLRSSYQETIYLLTSAAEFRDTDTGAHIRRVSFFTAAIARQMGMGEEFIDCIFFASPMHDIGKIAVPDKILLKPGPLDPPEWEIMKSHTTIGKQILSAGTTPYMTMGADIAQSHHERWDGSGYPFGVRGDAIPLPGRIMSICDTYDALRSSRPYKPALGHAEAVRIITEGDGRTDPGHFNPTVLRAFESSQTEFAEIYDAHGENPPEAADGPGGVFPSPRIP